MGLRGRGRKKRLAVNEDVRGVVLLCVDSAGGYLNVALIREDFLLAEYSGWHPFSHARNILPVVDLILAGQGILLEQVDAFGVCLGPGSFTGIRVALATVKALGLTTGKPAVGVSALELFARAILDPLPIGCMIDAKRGQVYTGLFGPPRASPSSPNASGSNHGGSNSPAAQAGISGARPVLLPAEASSPEEGFKRLAAGTDATIILAGSGVPLYLDRLPAELRGRFTVAPARNCKVSPNVLGAVCLEGYRLGAAVDAELLEPLYVGRPPIHQ